MMTRFEISFDRVIGHEGGFTADRNDRGNWTSGKIGVGELRGTKFGISAMSYPGIDIKNLKLSDAQEIYLRDFWKSCRCDELPSGLDYLVFDAAINHGKKQAIIFVQQAAGVATDGVIGPQTIKAANSKSGIIDEFCSRRAVFYAGISTFKNYGLGWMRRLVSSHSLAIKDFSEK